MFQAIKNAYNAKLFEAYCTVEDKVRATLEDAFDKGVDREDMLPMITPMIKVQIRLKRLYMGTMPV
jgi:hypothetical protein